MIKTQIQLPEELHRDLKRLAEAKEWSLAETLRRGAELLLAGILISLRATCLGPRLSHAIWAGGA